MVLWTESSFGVDVIYSDLLSLFASIACSFTVMPDGTDLFAEVQTELLSVCVHVCVCDIKGGIWGICMFESLYILIDVWRESFICKRSPKQRGKRPERVAAIVFLKPS